MFEGVIGILGFILIFVVGPIWLLMDSNKTFAKEREFQTAAKGLGFTSQPLSLWKGPNSHPGFKRFEIFHRGSRLSPSSLGVWKGSLNGWEIMICYVGYTTGIHEEFHDNLQKVIVFSRGNSKICLPYFRLRSHDDSHARDIEGEVEVLVVRGYTILAVANSERDVKRLFDTMVLDYFSKCSVPWSVAGAVDWILMWLPEHFSCAQRGADDLTFRLNNCQEIAELIERAHQR